MKFRFFYKQCINHGILSRLSGIFASLRYTVCGMSSAIAPLRLYALTPFFSFAT